jgi:protein CpxP
MALTALYRLRRDTGVFKPQGDTAMKAVRYAAPLLLACAWMLSQPVRAEARPEGRPEGRMRPAGPMGPGLPFAVHESGMPHLPMHLLKLSDEQEDRIYAILHAQEPAMRKLQRAAAKQREAMHALGDTVPFDERKAAALAQEAGTLHAETILQRTRTHAQVLAVLTPEQRAQLANRGTAPRGVGPEGRPRGKE